MLEETITMACEMKDTIDMRLSLEGVLLQLLRICELGDDTPRYMTDLLST